MEFEEKEKLLILEALLDFEHSLSREFEKFLKENNFNAQKVISKRIDEVDDLIDKIRNNFE